MKVDYFTYLDHVGQAMESSRMAERMACDGWRAPETKADAFLACAVAAQATTQIELGTGIGVAFARNPMTVAMVANDLHRLSHGRFVLGIGSQIRAHIESRFSMPWSQPAARMREFVLAVRAIWKTWETGQKLDFRGDFYTHTLMTPMFDPGPNPYGSPKVHVAAVGEKMTEIAGEVADGLLCHALCTERFLREVTLPALQRGAARAGRDLTDFEITAPGFIVADERDTEIERGVESVRRQIGFYASTPAYRPVLDLHGFGELQWELQQLTRRDAWSELAHVITDEVLDTFLVAGSPEQAATELRHRFGDVATRVCWGPPPAADPERWSPVFDSLRAPEPAVTRQ